MDIYDQFEPLEKSMFAILTNIGRSCAVMPALSLPYSRFLESLEQEMVPNQRMFKNKIALACLLRNNNIGRPTSIDNRLCALKRVYKVGSLDIHWHTSSLP